MSWRAVPSPASTMKLSRPQRSRMELTLRVLLGAPEEVPSHCAGAQESGFRAWIERETEILSMERSSSPRGTRGVLCSKKGWRQGNLVTGKPLQVQPQQWGKTQGLGHQATIGQRAPDDVGVGAVQAGPRSRVRWGQADSSFHNPSYANELRNLER